MRREEAGWSYSAGLYTGSSGKSAVRPAMSAGS
jgi:hypothetical protein